VLSWHQGAPRLRARPQSVTADPHIRRLEHRAGGQYEEYRFLPAPHEASPGMAVADHGRLVAVAETQESLPPALRRLLRPLLPRVPLLQRQRRVLTLYRDQRVLGRHTIALDPRALLTPATTVSLAYGLRAAGYLPAVFAREHLAFNAQNTRLAWVVETKKGKTLYVFAVPQVR